LLSSMENMALAALSILVEHISQRRSLKTDADASQLEGAVEDRSPFKPAEVLQLHAQQKPSTAAAHFGDRSPFKPAEVLQLHAQQKPSTAAAHPGGASGVPEQDNHLAANASAAQSARAVPEQEAKAGCEAKETHAAGPLSRWGPHHNLAGTCVAWKQRDLKKCLQGFSYSLHPCYYKATHFSASNTRGNMLRLQGTWWADNSAGEEASSVISEEAHSAGQGPAQSSAC
jgi:hypothetical protein